MASWTPLAGELGVRLTVGASPRDNLVRWPAWEILDRGTARMWLIFVVPLALLSLRGSRWAYCAFVLFAIGFLPARAGFQIQPLLCETQVSVAGALYSLQNWKHVLLCMIVALMTLAQFHERAAREVVVAILATVSLGFVAELEQGFFRNGHCRMRDLVPDTAGAMLGAAVGFAWSRRQANNALHLTAGDGKLDAGRR